MWRTPFRSCMLPAAIKSDSLALSLSDKEAFFAALPSATEKSITSTLQQVNGKTDPEIKGALANAICTQLPSFSPSSASSVISSFAKIRAAAEFHETQQLLTTRHWNLLAAKIIIALHSPGLKGHQFPEGTALFRQLVDLRTCSLSPEDTCLMLQALKYLSKRNPLAFDEIDALGAMIVNFLSAVMYPLLADIYLSWITLRPQCAKGRKRHLAVAQSVVLALRGSTITRLPMNVAPLFAPHLGFLVSPERELLYEMDSLCFQRLVWGCETVQRGCKTVNVHDWVRVLTCIMDFTLDRMRMHEGCELPGFVHRTFLVVSEQVRWKVNPQQQSARPNDIVDLLELFVQWIRDPERRRAIALWAKDYIIAYPRDRVSNTICRDLARFLGICLSHEDYLEWCNAMQISKDHLPYKLPAAQATPRESPVASTRNACVHQEAIQWASSYELRRESSSASPAKEFSEVANAFSQRLASIERTLNQQQLPAARLEHQRIQQGVQQQESEVKALREELSALQRRLGAIEKSSENSVTNRAKEVLQAVIAPTEEAAHPTRVSRFDFDAWLNSQQQRSRNFHDPLSLATFQSQFPRPGK